MSKASGEGCHHDPECASGACRDWGNFDKRCCPSGEGNRWDQCGHLPHGAACKNWDGSQCTAGRCHDWKCNQDLPPLGDALNPLWHIKQRARKAARELVLLLAALAVAYALYLTLAK